jgi:hypothetical protein
MVKQFNSGKDDAAALTFLKPSMGRVLDLMPRWSYSSRLFRSFEDRSLVLLGSMSAFCISCTVRARPHSHRGDLMGHKNLDIDIINETR